LVTGREAGSMKGSVSLLAVRVRVDQPIKCRPGFSYFDHSAAG
jgi:hypothetical protein